MVTILAEMAIILVFICPHVVVGVQTITMMAIVVRPFCITNFFDSLASITNIKHFGSKNGNDKGNLKYFYKVVL